MQYVVLCLALLVDLNLVALQDIAQFRCLNLQLRVWWMANKMPHVVRCLYLFVDLDLVTL